MAPFVVYKSDSLDPSWTVGGPQVSHFSTAYPGLFLGVLAKTQFVQNVKTQFENTKTQFENAKTQFEN